MLGMTPTQYRGGGVNEEIRFAVGQSSLGALLVASSKRGVAAILLGDQPEALVRSLQDRFPKARLIGADRDYEALVARVVGMIEAPDVGRDLPLDIRGTAFQQRVWRALQEIPLGQTVSYAEVARRIGSPKAVRAVAGACAANNLAVAIPCHRVVRNDGSLSGYAWGVERKRALLAREAAGMNMRPRPPPARLGEDASAEARWPAIRRAGIVGGTERNSGCPPCSRSCRRLRNAGASPRSTRRKVTSAAISTWPVMASVRVSIGISDIRCPICSVACARQRPAWRGDRQ